MANLTPPHLQVVFGSGSDVPEVREPLIERLVYLTKASKGAWTIDFDIASAHRSPRLVRELCEKLKSRNTAMVLAVGGAAFALPGALAAELQYIPVYSLPLGAKGAKAAFLSAACLPPGTPAPSFVTNEIVEAASYTIDYMEKVVPLLSKNPVFSIMPEGDYGETKLANAFETTAKEFGVQCERSGIGYNNEVRVSLNKEIKIFGIYDVEEGKLQRSAVAPIIGMPGLAKNGALHAARMLATVNPEIREKLIKFAKENEKKVIAANEKLKRELSA